MPTEKSSSTSSETSANQPSTGGTDALERLRSRVERAASEVVRLRAANAELAERVQELSQNDVLAEDDAPVAAPVIPAGDPDALREKINGFIEALDRVLAERASTGPPDPAA